MNAVGERVRVLREQRDLSQAALASLVGVQQTTISNIETGYANPSLKTAVRLAKIFGVTVDDLLVDVEPIS